MYQYFLPNTNVCLVTNDYLVLDDKGDEIKCYVYLNKKYALKDNNSADLILFFYETEPKTRIHINLKDKLIGLPEYGQKNYKYNNEKISLFNKNFFYNDGSLYHPFFKDIDIHYEFGDNYVKFETFGNLKRYGNLILIKSLK